MRCRDDGNNNDKESVSKANSWWRKSVVHYSSMKEEICRVYFSCKDANESGAKNEASLLVHYGSCVLISSVLILL